MICGYSQITPFKQTDAESGVTVGLRKGLATLETMMKPTYYAIRFCMNHVNANWRRSLASELLRSPQRRPS